MKKRMEAAQRARAGVESGVWLTLAGVALIVVAVVVFRARRFDNSSAGGSAAQPQDPTTAQSQASPIKAAGLARGGEADSSSPPAGTDPASSQPPSPAAPPKAAPLTLPAPSAKSRQMVNALTQWDAAAGPMSPERVAE